MEEVKSTLTLSEAAKLTGYSKSRLHKALNIEGLGRLSASRDEAGQYQIDRSELERVFSPADWPSKNADGERQNKHRAPVVLAVHEREFGTPHSAVLQAKLEAAEAMLAEANRNLERERERADRAETERRALLEAPKEEVQRERAERERDRQERERERAGALQRDEERRAEAERLRADLDRERQERDRLAREAEELRQALLKPKGLWSRITGR